VDGQQRIENTTDEGGDVYEVLCTGVVEGSRALWGNLGITINLDEIPEVAEYHAELKRSGWIERWPSWMFRKSRRLLEFLKQRSQQAVMTRVIEQGTRESTSVLVKAYPAADLEDNG
jgi:hypothetical protein